MDRTSLKDTRIQFSASLKIAGCGRTDRWTDPLIEMLGRKSLKPIQYMPLKRKRIDRIKKKMSL